jgi:hypothetical protein
MKLTIKAPANKPLRISDLPAGTVYRRNGNTWLKVRDITSGEFNSNLGTHAMTLKSHYSPTFKVMYNSDDGIVEEVLGTLEIGD